MGGHFSWLPSFEGAKGGDPPKKFQLFFYQKLPNYHIFKVRKKNNHVLYAKYCIIFISARVGGGPPMGDRVNPTFPGGEGGAIICFSDEFVVISPMYLNYHNCTYR